MTPYAVPFRATPRRVTQLVPGGPVPRRPLPQRPSSGGIQRAVRRGAPGSSARVGPHGPMAPHTACRRIPHVVMYGPGGCTTGPYPPPAAATVRAGPSPILPNPHPGHPVRTRARTTRQARGSCMPRPPETRRSRAFAGIHGHRGHSRAVSTPSPSSRQHKTPTAGRSGSDSDFGVCVQEPVGTESVASVHRSCSARSAWIWRYTRSPPMAASATRRSFFTARPRLSLT
jgi:hypothetical protein